ncbi:MAG: 50S ribosomal protein L17 [Planctomycetes bacterium]|nr:50S ribosomal protein L17 [Planctomycetota bacterium]
MRHKIRGRKLNRSTAHRKALGRNLFRELITHHRIITTPEKAKHYKSFAEKLITLSKEKNLHNVRRAMAQVPDKTVIKKLFDEIGPHFKDRPGGYTRIVRLAKNRLGDNGGRAIWELVGLDKTVTTEGDE